MAKEKTITLDVNGLRVETTVPAHRTLLAALRALGFVDVKSGCEKGDCGACAVLIDGEAFDSCLTLAWTAAGKAITTVSGLGGGNNDLHPLQRAFAEVGAIQCGYCTPGLIIAARSIIAETPEPSDEEIRFGLSGNLCRCTGYTKVFEAVRGAAAAMREAGERE